MTIITPKPISGFPEWLPEEKILELRLLDIIRSNFERYGFSPIETSAVERTEVLTAKGGNDREIYAINRLVAVDDEEGRNLALHFDLTVPLARYVAQNFSKIAFPFRRYQIQKVWRGERPQSGRYREFYQCDIDVIGDGELSLFTDAEIPSVIYSIFRQMEIGPFVIRINNRKILQGYLRHLGIPDERHSETLKLIDKMEKIGIQRVFAELANAGIQEDIGKKLIDFVDQQASNDETLKKLQSINANETFRQGIDELATVVKHIRALGVPEDYFQIFIGIARGLDYYTGTIYETVLKNHPGIGSICSGGRYDDLASYFIERRLPGVGISIGLTRLFSRLLQAKILSAGSATPAPVLVALLETDRITEYLSITTILREAGVNTEMFFEDKKLGNQLKYADKKGIPLVVIAGSEEFSQNSVKIKNLKTGQEKLVPKKDIVSGIELELNDLRSKNLYT